MPMATGRRTAWIRGAAFVLASSGIAICLTWFFGLEDATRLISESTYVQFVTALTFVAMACAFWQLTVRRFRWAAGLAATVLAIALLTLAEYFFGLDFGLDTLFPSTPPLPGVPYPGRMAGNTAVAMALASTATIALALGWRRAWVPALASMLAALVVANGVVAALGYAFDLTPAMEWSGLSRMALLTALLSALVGLVVIIAALQVAGAVSGQEPPWIAASMGLGAAALALLAWRALHIEHPSHEWGSHEFALGLGLVSAALLTATVAQSRNLRLQSRALAAANDRLRHAMEQTQIFTALVENSSDFIGIADLQGKPVYVNPAGRQMIGMPADYPVEQSAIPDYYAPDQRDLATNVIVPVMAETGLWRGETALRHWQTGEAIPVSDEHFMIRDRETGRLLGMGTVTRDISDRHRAEAFMRQAAAVFKSTTEAIVVLDADACITTVNPAFSRITGYDAEEAHGLSMAVISRQGDGAAFYDAMWRDLQTIGQWSGEIWSQRKDGVVFPTLFNANVVRDDHGKVIQYVAVFTDISSIKAAEARLTHMAHHDPLTGLPNRSLFGANLEQALRTAKRRQHRVGILLLDLDRFKLINDTLGHAAGDTLLMEIARRMRGCVRDEDTIARLGGDEFAIILGDLAEAQDACGLAEKVLEAVKRPVMVEGKPITTSTSIGIGLFPDDAGNAEELLRAADIAMYRAKAKGRNAYEFHTAELSTTASEAMTLEADLHQALRKGELVLYYQPQFDVASRELSGIEALLRWNHPTRGLILPGRFLKIAEDSGLIREIGEWVLEEAYCQAERWRRASKRVPRIAVNISGKQIQYDDLAAMVEKARSRHPDADLSLEVELVEDVLLSLEQGADKLRRLRESGAIVAIDDFGTGHSSLSRLMHLPVDTLKIDKSFILALPGAGESTAITAAIVAMGHSLGLRVVAEGVENQSQLDLLRDLHCDEVQGFFLAAPMPASALEALLDG